MGRKAWSIGVLSLLGLVSVVVAGSYQPEFSFLTSASNNYSPLSNYYVTQQQQQPASYQKVAAAPVSPLSSRPVIRKNRGLHGHHDHHHHDHHHGHVDTYYTAPVTYVSKALYYPESAVFSDPLPIVPLPQLPAEFLTLKTAQVSNTGAYGGSENEVPKKASGKKARRGKKAKVTPAPVEEEEEEEDAQETEGDSEGGYESPKPRQRQRSRQREEGLSAQGEEATGGYPASFNANANTDREPLRASAGQRGRSRGEGRSNQEAEGQGDGATGGYPSSFDANAEDESSGNKSRPRSRGRSNKNRGSSQEEEEEDTPVGEIEGDEEDEEIMMTGDDAEGDEENARDDAAEEEAVAADEEKEEEEAPKRGRSKNQGGRSSGKRGGKKRGKGRSRGGSSEDDEAALNAALSDEGQKIPTIFVPTFGQNVLNTVYPAYSQNALLRSLEAQVGLGGDQGYPESGQDVSAISITADDKKKRRKAKKRTSARKNRPASRSRSSSRRSKNRPAVRAQEPNDQNQGGYPNSPQQTGGNQGGYSTPSQSQSSQGQNQQYGPPQFTPGNPSSEYGAPSSQQSQSGISPPPQNGGQGGYRTINNEMRGRTSDLPASLRQQPRSEYGAPSSSRVSQIEPRQLSQIAVSSNDNQFPAADSNNPVTAELIRTVQAILQRYPN